MSRCTYIKLGGERCRGVVVRGSDLCAAHHPDTRERRRRGAAKGGRTTRRNPAREEVEQVRRILRIATDQLLRPERPSSVAEGSEDQGELHRKFRIISRADCAVLANVCNVRLRVVETERRLIELDEVLARIEVLEERADDLPSKRRYGF
jgi:hypothetical protein